MAYYEAGVYQNVPIVAQRCGKSEKKGTPYFAITIKPGEHTRDIIWYLPDGNKDAAMRLMDALGILGFDGSSFLEIDPENDKFWDFTKTIITAECRHEPYDGKITERWQLPFAGIAKVVTPLDSKELRKMDALFGKELKERFGGKRRATTMAPAVAKPQQSIEAELAENPPSDSDMPF